MMADMLRQQDDQSSDQQSDDESPPLNLTEATEISDLPLPNLFYSNGFSHGYSAKGACEWTSGRLTDISEQPPHGDFFHDFKK
jgi:hypothetical protein